jgi:deazaflavin-dependent oxidoreductase (nitroreductase family)
VTTQPRPTWDELKPVQGIENARVVKEFHQHEGRVERYAFPVVLLHHTGAKSGLHRINPLAYLPVDDDFAVFATCAGSPRHPDWYRNLVAHPRTTIEVGGETIDVHARITSGDERTRIWDRQKAAHPHFAEMEAMTTREIPVVLLERA